MVSDMLYYALYGVVCSMGHVQSVHLQSFSCAIRPFAIRPGWFEGDMLCSLWLNIDHKVTYINSKRVEGVWEARWKCSEKTNGKCLVSVCEVCGKPPGKCAGSVGGRFFGSGWVCGIEHEHS